MDPVVSTEWLAERLGNADLAVLDCTYFLPAEAQDAQTLFAQAHIPGARFFDIDVFADPDSALPHMAPSAGRFARLFGALGIDRDTSVVFYDQRGLFSAGRGWWLAGLFGHACAAVLDGGLPKWRREDRPTETGMPVPATPRTYVADLHAARVRGLGDLLDNLHARQELVVDVRAADRFHARVPEPRPGMRGGHIPGAINLPYAQMLSQDGTLRPRDELRARLRDAGIDGTRPVVTSCGSGVSATIVTLAMAHAGLPPGAVYDGSWTEWGGRPDTPLET